MRRLLLLTIFLAACSDIPEIDQYFTFNLTPSAIYSIPPTPSNGGGSATATITINPIDLDKQGTSAANLRTAKITRVQLSGPSVSAFVYARLLIGADTVADSLYSDKGEYFMRARSIDITEQVRTTAFDTKLEYGTKSAISDSTTLTTNFTIAITALPR